MQLVSGILYTLNFLPVYVMFLFGASRNAQAEVFSAVADVHKLVHAEGDILFTLRQLIEVEKLKLTQIQEYMKDFTLLYRKIGFDTDRSSVLHPVNAFAFVKHSSVDWEHLRQVLFTDYATAAVIDIEKQRSLVRFPTEEDLQGLAEAFVRLQKTYNISTEILANGRLSSRETRTPELSALDCYVIGHRLALAGNYYYSVTWLEMALDKFNQQVKQIPHLHKVDILDWLQYSYYHTGDAIHALQLTNQILQLDPEFPTANINHELYTNLTSNRSSLDTDMTMKISNWSISLDAGGLNEALCRGEGTLTTDIQRQLRCFHQTWNNRLLLQPAKFEQLYIDPDIFLIHNVISDKEIHTMKQIGMVLLQRAGTVPAGSSTPEYTNFRISKLAFLPEEIHPLISTLNQRIGYLTNLNSSQAEQLQVANYGIGGHFQPHYDFFRYPLDSNNTYIQPHLGDRMATVLIYMTDVEAGGATTFPYLNLTVYPQKGSALFWYNLHLDGRGDVRTQHSGCPVLIGNKWVINKWICEVGQDATRPCGLMRDSMRSEVPTIV